MTSTSKQEESLANVDPLVATKDSLDARLVEKQQTFMENKNPPENTRNLVEKETSWAHQADEKDFKNNIVQLLKNDPHEFAEKVGWIQVFLE